MSQSKDHGRAPSGQALAVPATPAGAVDGPTGFDPSRKPWPLCGYAPGDYMGRCVECEKEFEGDKRALQCLECAAMSAKGLIGIYQAEARELREWRDARRAALDELIRAAAVFWGAGSEQHNLIRDVADALFRDASGTEARQRPDPAEGLDPKGDGPTAATSGGDAQQQDPTP